MAESEVGCQEKRILSWLLPSWITVLEEVISPFLHLGFLLCVMAKDIHNSEILSNEPSVGIQMSPDHNLDHLPHLALYGWSSLPNPLPLLVSLTLSATSSHWIF